MQIDRVILSSNDNPKYLEFWDLVSEAWVRIGKIKPTLFVISDKDLGLSTKYGDVFYQSPAPHVPTAQQSQIVRLFAATKFPKQICLTSDLDMLPLQSAYFKQTVSGIEEDKIVFYSSDAYLPGSPSYPSFPMCYMCASGETFAQILGCSLSEFPREVDEWMNHGHGWFTDEKVFYQKWNKWKDKAERTVYARRGFNMGGPHTINRIDRPDGSMYDRELLYNGRYIDYHMPRPYSENKKKIDEIYRICRESIS
jgi:hypothetical protein